MNEEWRDIDGFEGLYQVSSMGNVKSLWFGKERIMKLCVDGRGYCFVGLYKEGKKRYYQIHRLVAQAFIPNPNNYPIINHKDENPSNNYIENLEWCSYQYNSNYGTRNERISKANQKPIVQIHKSGLIIGVWSSATQADNELGIYQQDISKCCKGKRNFCGGYKWKFLNELKKVS